MLWSYVHGASDTPLLGETIGVSFERSAARHAGADALVVPFQQIRWSYRELARRVDEVAAGLLALGLVPGERVGICAPNCAEWVVLQFATARAGLVLVNLNPAYRVEELAFALSATGCRALVTARRHKSSDYLAMLRQLMPELPDCAPGRLRSTRLPELRWVIGLGGASGDGVLAFERIADRAGAAEREQLRRLAHTLQFDDPVNIQFTSGTTGTPKAATLTHHNVLNNARFVARRMNLTTADRMCIPVPMYHCFGMVLGTLCCVVCGAAMVLPAPSFDPGETLAAIEAERCTVLHGVPTMFIAALEEPGFAQHDLASLRTGIMAGAPCPEELMRRVMNELHLPEITIAYGMTETGPVSFQTRVDDPLERRVETVGRVLPHTEVKIVDAEGRVVPRGTTGELLTRGYCVMRGYWDDPERTSAAIDGARWIASGDLAVVDAQGYCRIVGRAKDMLIRGGENIYPREIEEFLYRHPKIDAVEVIGVPDPRYGEEVCAWVKLRPGESMDADELREYCRGQIAHFKIPRYVEFVTAFPMTVTGKVQKFAMREQMIAQLAQAGRASADVAERTAARGEP